MTDPWRRVNGPYDQDDTESTHVWCTNCDYLEGASDSMDCPNCDEPLLVSAVVEECEAGPACDDEDHHWGLKLHVREVYDD